MIEVLFNKGYLYTLTENFLAEIFPIRRKTLSNQTIFKFSSFRKLEHMLLKDLLNRVIPNELNNIGLSSYGSALNFTAQMT